MELQCHHPVVCKAEILCTNLPSATFLPLQLIGNDILSKMWFKAQLETQLDDPCHSYLTIQLTEKYSAAIYH